MTTLYDRAMAQFADARGELVPIEVPEWEATVYFYPVMTYEERAAIARHVSQRTGETDPEAYITTLIKRARDENGRRLWTEPARESLHTKYDPTVLERLVVAMNAHTPEVESDEEKKSD